MAIGINKTKTPICDRKKPCIILFAIKTSLTPKIKKTEKPVKKRIADASFREAAFITIITLYAANNKT